MTVSLFVTCLTDLFYPDVAECVVRILRRLGHRVEFPYDQTCCGQPALNSGYMDEFRKVAARAIKVFENAETVVTPSGSCCSIVREYYPHVFKDDPAMHARAVAMAGKTFEFVEFVEKVLKVDWSPWRLRYPGVGTYHYSCHHRGIGLAPETIIGLLQKIEAFDYRPMEKLDQCCGFGGTFAVKYPDISGAIVRDKVACIRASGAELLVCNDGGCTMNIMGACRREGVNIQVRHIAQIIDAAMQKREGQSGREGERESEMAVPSSLAGTGGDH